MNSHHSRQHRSGSTPISPETHTNNQPTTTARTPHVSSTIPHRHVPEPARLETSPRVPSARPALRPRDQSPLLSRFVDTDGALELAETKSPPRGLHILLESLRVVNLEQTSPPLHSNQTVSPPGFEGEERPAARTLSSHSNALTSIASHTRTNSSDFSTSRFPLPPTSTFLSSPSELDTPHKPREEGLFSSIFDYPDDGLEPSECQDQQLPPSSIPFRDPPPSLHSDYGIEGSPASTRVHITAGIEPGSAELDMARPPASSPERHERNSTPQRALFEDLPTAYTSITSRNVSGAHSKTSTPSPEFESGAYRQGRKSPVECLSPGALRAKHFNQDIIMWPNVPLQSPSKTPDHRPQSPPTWKEKITNAFHRRAESKQNDQQATIKNLLETECGEHSADEASTRSPPYLRPFNRISQSSQSAPQFDSHNPYRDAGTDRVSRSAELRKHDDTNEMVWEDTAGSLASRSECGNDASNLSSVLQDDYHGKGHHLNVMPLPRSRFGDESACTVGETVASNLTDDWDDYVTESSEIHRTARPSGFSTFDFGFGSYQSGLSTSDRGDEARYQPSRTRQPFTPRNQPPTSPLPPLPPSASPRLDSLDSRDLFPFSEAVTPSTSYGDTRNLLNLTGPLPGESSEIRSQAAVNESSFSRLRDPSDDNLGGTGGQDRASEEDHDIEPLAPLFSPKANRDNDSFFAISNEGSHHSKSITEPSQSSGPSLKIPNKALEDEITRELRRVSRLSGISTGSVVVVNENTLEAFRRSSDQEGGPGDEHGGFQSSSSGDLIDIKGDASPHDSAQSDCDRDSGDQETKALGSWKKRGKEISAGSNRPDHEKFGEDFADEDEGDWETVAGSGALSRFGTGRDTTRALTGSSLANFSSFASLSPEEHRASFGITGEVLQHPGDPRYDFVYRLRQIAPGQTPVLLPSYKYPGGGNFPNRNALTPPLPANWNSRNPYRHPSPLSNEHTHPFKSSPPAIHPSPASNNGRLPRDEAEDDDRNLLTPAHHIASQDFSSNRQDERCINRDMSVPDSIGRSTLDGSCTSSAWMSVYGGMPREKSQSQSISGRDGSFAKVTRLGAKANITGTPEGTGMREVGSSLADGSSPFPKWSSSPNRFKSSPIAPMEPLPELSSPVTTPKSAVLKESALRPGTQTPPELDEQIKAHRDLLRSEGLLPLDGIPVPPPVKARILELGPQRRTSAQISPRYIDHENFSDGPDFHQSFGLASPQNGAPLLPLHSPEPDMMIGIEHEARLRHRGRENSSIAIFTRKRKRNISRIILAFCFCFPPLLLLYGYGVLDVVMLELTQGGIRRFGRGEKKFARCAGWVIGTAAIIAIIVSMIVVGVAK